MNYEIVIRLTTGKGIGSKQIVADIEETLKQMGDRITGVTVTSRRVVPQAVGANVRVLTALYAIERLGGVVPMPSLWMWMQDACVLGDVPDAERRSVVTRGRTAWYDMTQRLIDTGVLESGVSSTPINLVTELDPPFGKEWKVTSGRPATYARLSPQGKKMLKNGKHLIPASVRAAFDAKTPFTDELLALMKPIVGVVGADIEFCANKKRMADNGQEPEADVPDGKERSPRAPRPTRAVREPRALRG